MRNVFTGSQLGVFIIPQIPTSTKLLVRLRTAVVSFILLLIGKTARPLSGDGLDVQTHLTLPLSYLVSV